MFERLDLFRLSGALAAHSSQRQTVAAANIAQADTPGYRARVIEDFAAVHGPHDFAIRSTRAGHIHGAPEPGAARILIARSPASPDGNTVALESEMATAARATSDHDRAVGIYRHAMSVLRASIGGR